MKPDVVIREIHQAFDDNEYPGKHFLLGSNEGCEPAEAIEPFTQITDWKNIDPTLLDAHYTALSFFSEAGLRFFLPAYLIADIENKLQTAEPAMTLVGNFSDTSFKHQTSAGVFVIRTGRGTLVNPQRYGAMIFFDYARCRFSVFTREEARAIVSYLRYKQTSWHPRKDIDDALELFWLDRAENAPTAEQLRQHLKEKKEYLAAIKGDTTRNA